MDHEMAHIFWSSCITLAKRSGLFSQLAVEIPHDKKEDIEFLWRAWIQEEVAKRLAQIMFAVDVEREFFPSSRLCVFVFTYPSPRSFFQMPLSSDTLILCQLSKYSFNFLATKIYGMHRTLSNGNDSTTKHAPRFNSSLLSRLVSLRLTTLQA
jgi:hypothetical protein